MDMSTNKASYVFKVIMSCETLEQLSNAMNWSYNVFPEIWLSKLSYKIDELADKLCEKELDKLL